MSALALHDPVAPELRLLGPPAMLKPHPLPWLNERRFRLAAYLAVRGDWVGRDHLAALFWPERAQSEARSNLRKLLMELRALELPRLEIDKAGLRWQVRSDVGTLRAAHARGDTAAVAAIELQPLLQDLGSGDSEAFDAWLRAQRDALNLLWRDGVLQAIATGTPQAALSLAQRLLEADPLDEAALRAALAALRALDRPADAERLYARYRARLTAELGIEPDAALQALAPSTPAIGAAEPDAGSGFVGRDDELQELCALLNDRRCRLVTLTGPGGIGKSALALALLRSAVLVGADAAHWIALEDLHEAAQVLPRAARELGVTIGARSDGLQEIAAQLRGQHALLVLDNAEHLAGLAAIVQSLLEALPTLRCLVSSRAPLALADEWLLPLGPLSEAAARQLFVRAARAAPSRQPVAPDDPALAALVEQLGRLPLALCLAAAWTRHLPLPALVRETARALDVLELDASIDEHPSHHGLRATFERSWDFLSVPQQGAMAALSVCVGRVSLATAQAVAQAGAAGIAALAESSLLDIGTDGRISLHPLLRRFAAEKLSADAERAARERHAAVFAALMAPWKDFDHVDARQALDAIAPEISNVLLAWDHAVQYAPALLDDLAGALSNHYQGHGGIAQVLPRFVHAERVLLAVPQPPPVVLCRVALERAGLSFWLADYAAVEDAARHALRAARAARLGRPARQALNALALTSMRQGRSDDGARWLAQALALARSDGQAQEVTIYAGNLCGVLRELGQLERAQALALESLHGHRRDGHAVGQVSVLNELGLIAHQQDRLDEAFDWSAQALALIEQHTMALRRPVMLTHQASVRLDQGRAAEALALAERSLVLVQQAGARSHEPTLRRLLAEILLALDRRDAAREQLRYAAEMVPSLDAASTPRGLLCSLAAYAWYAGDAAEAVFFALCSELRRPNGAAALPRYRRLLDHAAAALGAEATQAQRAAAGAVGEAALRERLNRLLA
jgi:DNA-binding SARP family transcriptional activator/predicted ATPase